VIVIILAVILVWGLIGSGGS